MRMATTTEMHLPSSAGEGGRSNRFNYLGMHRYLITLPAFKSDPVFKEPEVVLGVLDSLRDASLAQHFDVYAYSFLPDMLTLVVRGKEDKSDMKQFLVTFRHASSDRLEARLGHPLWKKKYTERVLRRQEDTKAVAREIFQGPVRAGLARVAEEYEFQGSFVTNVTRTLSEPTTQRWKERRPSFGRTDGKQQDSRRPSDRRRRFPDSGRGGGRPKG
jgi:hypothetical protein